MKAKTRSSQQRAVNKMKLAARISQQVELVNIFLIQSGAERKPIQANKPIGINVTVNVSSESDRERGLIHVYPSCVLVTHYRDQPDKELVRIEARFVLVYRVPSFKGLRKDHVKAFGELNGLYNAWPYWREYVQAMTVRMGLPAISMPVYRVPVSGGIKARSKTKASLSTARRRRASAPQK